MDPADAGRRGGAAHWVVTAASPAPENSETLPACARGPATSGYLTSALHAESLCNHRAVPAMPDAALQGGQMQTQQQGSHLWPPGVIMAAGT